MRVTLAAAIGLALAAAAPAPGWYAEGHRRIAEGAVALLPDEVPAAFRDGAAAIGAAAVDPDLWKVERLVPALDDGESPEHYYDWEVVVGAEPPPLRSETLQRLAERGIAPRALGFLPHAVVEGAERLALCFAEQRGRPEVPAIAAKCLVYAGWLAHYAGDLAQPLHTTIHHNGWALPNGEPSLSGFHFRIDSLAGAVAPDPAVAVAGIEPRAIGELWPAVLAELRASHALVDDAYALEPLLERGESSEPRVQAFACARYRAGARFLAELYLWSWRRSGELELPDWAR